MRGGKVISVVNNTEEKGFIRYDFFNGRRYINRIKRSPYGKRTRNNKALATNLVMNPRDLWRQELSFLHKALGYTTYAGGF